MDFDYSLSFHEGDNFSIEHDNREHIPKNVDADRISENIVYPENVPLQKFYEDTFQKASVTDPSETSGTWTNGPSWVKK